MEQNEEIELIKSAQAGNRQAFEALLQTYYDVIFKMAYKWTANRENAEDITQNVCIKLANSIDSFAFKSKFSSWLYRMVINSAIDWQKSNARHNAAEITENLKSESSSSAEKKLYAKEIFEQIAALPENEKTAILLVFSEDLTHKEAAKIMECKESTISWYIHEARKKLKDMNTNEGDASYG
jgi:RNA polymerase sigma-70 factor (ECF subfamily)